eukprot:6485529-Amphidinium_carterae.3
MRTVGAPTGFRKRPKNQGAAAAGCQPQEEAIGFGGQRASFAGSKGRGGQATGVAHQCTDQIPRTSQGVSQCECRPGAPPAGGAAGTEEDPDDFARVCSRHRVLVPHEDPPLEFPDADAEMDVEEGVEPSAKKKKGMGAGTPLTSEPMQDILALGDTPGASSSAQGTEVSDSVTREEEIERVVASMDAGGDWSVQGKQRTPSKPEVMPTVFGKIRKGANTEVGGTGSDYLVVPFTTVRYGESPLTPHPRPTPWGTSLDHA